MAQTAHYRYPGIAREGWPYVVAVAAAAAAVHYFAGGAWAVPLWLVAAGMLYLFRDPARAVPASPLGVVSPVDGRVESLATVEDPWLERQALQVRFRMNPLGVFSVRSPVEGKVARQWLPKARGRHPYAQWFQTDEGDDIVLAVVPQVRQRRTICYVAAGQRIGQGQRCGYIPFGMEVELLLPADSRARVQPGQRVASGVDIVANLVHGEWS